MGTYDIIIIGSGAGGGTLARHYGTGYQHLSRGVISAQRGQRFSRWRCRASPSSSFVRRPPRRALRIKNSSARLTQCSFQPAPYELILMYRQRCVSKQLQEALALLFVEPLRLKHDVEFLKRALIREGHLFGVVINDGGPRVFADVERFVE